MTTLHTAVNPPAAATATRRLTAWLQRHPLWGYGLLAYGISWLFLLGALVAIQFDLLPADSPIMGVANQIAAFGPALAALIVIAYTQGRTGVRQWLRRLVQWRVGIQWYLLILFGIPLISLLGASVLHGMRPFQALVEQWPILFTRYLPYVALTTVLTGLAEEPGWRGFAQPRFQAQHGPLLGTLLASLLWSFWHLPNLFFQPGGLYTFSLWFAATMVNGFVLAWVYNATKGSVLLVMLLHAAQNVTSSLVGNLLGATDAVQFMNEYYVVSAITYGVLIGIVILVTRGRLGNRATG